jgi:tetratricopeptide (TPR) repeat protein
MARHGHIIRGAGRDMAGHDLATLDAVAAAERVRALGLKRWWLAGRVGVDRKTVTRWLNGRVRRIQPEHLAALALHLRCAPEQLVLRDPAESVATAAEQAEAARMIERERLIDVLGPLGKWRALEGLIRASARPELPLPLLGDLYNQLSIAAWRQSHLDRAQAYAGKALAVGERCGSEAVTAAALLNAATIASYRGQPREAITLYRRVLAAARRLDDRLLAAKAVANLGSAHHDLGEFAVAVRWQRRALAGFKSLARPMNSAIAWLNIADALARSGRGPEAAAAVSHGERDARRAGYRRALADAALLRASLAADRGRLDEARAFLADARRVFAALGIREAPEHEIAARLCRLDGDLDGAERHLAVALPLAEAFPAERARLLRERGGLEHQRGRSRQARAAYAEAETIHRAMGAARLARMDEAAAGRVTRRKT